jgi:hypothetical protein
VTAAQLRTLVNPTSRRFNPHRPTRPRTVVRACTLARDDLQVALLRRLVQQRVPTVSPTVSLSLCLSLCLSHAPWSGRARWRVTISRWPCSAASCSSVYPLCLPLCLSHCVSHCVSPTHRGPGVHVGAGRQQRGDDLQVALLRRLVQQRVPALPAPPHPRSTSVGFGKPLTPLNIPHTGLYTPL